MPRNIVDIVIDKISLLTGSNEPAVPKADRKFAILKSDNKAKLEELKNELDDIENKGK